MEIKDLFLKPIDREIEGVIKADDLESLKTEVEEYVITNEIAKNLDILVKQYNQPTQGNNGVWISGFFGSGKSHLLKMLALFLESRLIDDLDVVETLLSKIPGIDSFLKAEMKKASAVPSQSILFNIDQKADAISKTDTDAVLGVFSRVFDEYCGYYGQHGFIAKFERDLDEQNLLQDFKDLFQEKTGLSWHEGREAFNFHRPKISQVYASLTGNSESSAKDIIQFYRDEYHLSIEDFANNVMKYIQSQEKGFRLNFFVDEVGQYVAENVKLMTNLQTIAESLATICKGQSWLFVTSQENIDAVLGAVDQRLGNDFSRIRDRFKCQLTLSSQDVAEVIQKRLLTKTDQGILDVRRRYALEHQNFGTLFSFPDGGMTFRSFRDEDEFVNSYPFIPYQYTLFQQSIEALSRHNAFTGKHNSVGERSMLGVFQDVVKAIGEQQTGAIGSFDLMFEGIRSALKSTNLRAILTAEEHLDNKFAIRVLKALFMVKYVKSFKATVRNLRVLMQTSFNEDIKALETRIQEALTLLENQTYIQRNDDLYEYLTEEEQDIESEIKSVIVENDDVYKTLEDLLFAEIIRDNKIRYEENQQDYNYAKRIDEKLRGKEQELSIDFITSYSDFADDLVALKGHCMGKAELMVVLPADTQFMSDILMFKKTESYIKQNHGMHSSETRNMILANKAMQNAERKKALSRKASELVSQAGFIISGDGVSIAGEDAKTRLVKAFNLLIAKVYTNLRMLGRVLYSENDIRLHLEPAANALFNSEDLPMNEAELEVFTFIQNNQYRGERTTMKKIEEHFSARPYGWYLAAIQCITAMLCGRGKLDPWINSELLENGPLEKALKNTYGFSNLVFDIKIGVPPEKVQVLKRFYSDFFSEPTAENDARNLVRNIKSKMLELKNRLSDLYDRRDRYPFMVQLKPALEKVDWIITQDFEYFTSTFQDEFDDWLTLQEKDIEPFLNFINTQKRNIYDALVDFHNRKKPDLPGEDAAVLEELINDPQIYLGNKLQQANVDLDGIKDRLEKSLEAERQKALDTIEKLQQDLHSRQDYQALQNEDQQQLDHSFEQVRYTINQHALAVSIREKVGTYEVNEYPALLTKMNSMAPGKKEQSINRTYVHIDTVNVPFKMKTLESSQDVLDYCRAIEQALLKAVEDNKMINL